MARSIQVGKLTPADELRDLLDRVERRLGSINGARAEDVIEMFDWLDRIVPLFAEIEADGVDLRPERTRWENIDSMMHAKAGRIVRQARGQIAPQRATRQPPSEHWWWWLDEHVREQTRRRIQRSLITVAAVAVLALVAYSVFNALFPTNPAVERAQGLQLAAERAVMEGNWAEAERQFAQAVQETPDDVMLWAWLGVVREEQGNQAGAEEAFARAREVAGSELTFHLARGQVYIQANRSDKALAEAERAVELAPDSAQAHFLLASAYELSGRFVEAIAEFEKTSKLAENKEPQLVVLARMRMGMLLQTGGGLGITNTVTTTAPAP
jgi:tetratricopeptide (TPR) repeat protein